MANDERHMALPKLYGQPAYARPFIVPVAPVERPFDPDDLPLEVEQTSEEREVLAQVEGGGDVPGDAQAAGSTNADDPSGKGRPFRLGTITARIKGDGGPSAGA